MQFGIVMSVCTWAIGLLDVLHGCGQPSRVWRERVGPDVVAGCMVQSVLLFVMCRLPLGSLRLGALRWLGHAACGTSSAVQLGFVSLVAAAGV